MSGTPSRLTNAAVDSCRRPGVARWFTRTPSFDRPRPPLSLVSSFPRSAGVDSVRRCTGSGSGLEGRLDGDGHVAPQRGTDRAVVLRVVGETIERRLVDAGHHALDLEDRRGHLPT